MLSELLIELGTISKFLETPPTDLENLKIGEVSKPIKSLNSFIFFKLVDKRISKINKTNTEEFKKRLINQRKNELFNLYSRSHLSKLKNNSLIEYK